MPPLIALHAALTALGFVMGAAVLAHKGFMIGTFLGLVGAGPGALVPGRAFSRLFF